MLAQTHAFEQFDGIGVQDLLWADEVEYGETVFVADDSFTVSDSRGRGVERPQ
jgi:hypothetical protein